MKILLTGAFNYSKEQIEEIKKMNLEVIFEQDESNIKTDVSDIDMVVGNAIFLHNDIRKFKKLKYIQLTSAGLDRVPIDYIKENNIKLYNARGVYSIPMAEWVICKILDYYKQSFTFYENQKNKLWNKQRDIKELTDRVVAIIGYGNVGQEIAKRLYSFGTKIIAVDSNKKQDSIIDQFYFIENLKEALKKSDIVILALPLLDSTIGLFDKDTFQNMKFGSILVNVSRGKIINEKDLIEEIKNGRFDSVILDVFENEPLSSNSEIWNLDNVIITPHNSFVSNNNDERLYKLIIDNLKREFI